jgi:hypothetical protein
MPSAYTAALVSLATPYELLPLLLLLPFLLLHTLTLLQLMHRISLALSLLLLTQQQHWHAVVGHS